MDYSQEEGSKSPKNSKSRKLWTHQETKSLLDAYNRRKSEFSHPRRKKFAWQNVAEDLGSTNIFNEAVTPGMCENKMKSLLRAYKHAIDSANRTGIERSYVPFKKELVEIFGNNGIVRKQKANVSKQITEENSASSESANDFYDDLNNVVSESMNSFNYNDGDSIEQKYVPPTFEADDEVIDAINTLENSDKAIDDDIIALKKQILEEKIMHNRLEHEQKITQSLEEHKIKMKILKAELRIKESQLK